MKINSIIPICVQKRKSAIVFAAILDRSKPCIELSESTLYTILKRLETADMLTVRTVEHGGRLRKYYHITDKGLKRIEDFKDEWKGILSIYRFVTKEDDGNE